MSESVSKIDMRTSHNDVAEIMQRYPGQYEMMSAVLTGCGRPAYQFIGLNSKDLLPFLREMHSLCPDVSYGLYDTKTKRPFRASVRGVILRAHDISAAEHLEKERYSLN